MDVETWVYVGVMGFCLLAAVIVSLLDMHERIVNNMLESRLAKEALDFRLALEAQK